jgi:hypothetical protein
MQDIDSRGLNKLGVDFRNILVDVLTTVKGQGFELVPYCTLRGPVKQAKLWCQSRHPSEIVAAAKIMEDEGAPNLSALLDVRVAMSGKWATNALPGKSWHQWGTAADCFVLENGKAIWDPAHAGYMAYAVAGIKAGLTAGAFFKQRDMDHLQMPKDGEPLLGWADVERAMLGMYA